MPVWIFGSGEKILFVILAVSKVVMLIEFDRLTVRNTAVMK